MVVRIHLFRFDLDIDRGKYLALFAYLRSVSVRAIVVGSAMKVILYVVLFLSVIAPIMYCGRPLPALPSGFASFCNVLVLVYY